MRLLSTPLGRVLVPERVPPGFALFYTTRDVDGRLSDDVAKTIADIARKDFGVVPPKVEYRLTSWGQSLCPALDALLAWLERRQGEMEPPSP